MINTYTNEYLEQTKNIFQPHSEVQITKEAAAEMADNLLSLYELMLKINKKYGRGNLN